MNNFCVLYILPQPQLQFLSFLRARMSEATTSGEILRVEAKDADTDPRNRAFQFKIDSNRFLVDTNGDFAVIRVNQVSN